MKNNRLLMRLEDRILFDAAAAAEIAAAENAVNAAVQTEAAPENAGEDAADAVQALIASSSALPVPDDPAENAKAEVASQQQLVEGPIPAVQEDSAVKNELIVVNSSVQDIDAVKDAAGENAEIIVLSQRNGLTELLDQLNDSEVKYDAIHFITHGNENELSINGDLIRNENFDAEPWKELGTHLNDNADLLFYGCDAAKTESGRMLIDNIADAAGADAAASDDATGINGDWDLEYTYGDVTTEAIAVDGYEHDLESGSATVTSFTELENAISSAADGTYSEYTITLDSDITMEYSLNSLFDYDLTLNITGEHTLDGNSNSGIFQFGVTNDVTLSFNFTNITFENANDSAIYGSFLGGTVNFDIRNCTFSNNSASDGGAININYETVAGASGTVSITDSYFDTNTADNQGGAINISGGNLSILRSSFSGNAANGGSPYGGGAIAATDTDVTILNSTFYNNAAGIGGALQFYDSNDGLVNTAFVLDSTFMNNTASETDGGNAVHNEGVNLSIANSILVTTDKTAEDVHDEGGTARIVYSIYGKTNVADDHLVGNVSGKISSDIFSGSFDSKTHTVAIKNDAEAAYKGVLLGYSENSYYYSTDGSAWKNVQNDTSPGSSESVTAITADQLSGDRNKWTTDLNINEYAVGAVVPATLLIKAEQQDAELVYNGKQQDSDVIFKSAGDKDIASDKISGVTAGKTTSKNVGTYESVTPDISSAAVIGKTGYEFQAGSCTITITPKSVTISGLTASDKVYDGTTTATVKTDAAEFDGKIAGDELGVSTTGTFSDKNVGVNKTVTFGMLELTGTDKGNYTVSDSSQKTTTASITPKSVTISGLTASDKVYDGTTTATVQTDAVIFDGKIAGDELGVSTTGTFSDKNVGVNKTVTFGMLELTGTDKGNYTVSDSSQKTTTASITPKSVTISGLTVSDKVYDGTTTATVKTDAAEFDGKVTGDELGVSTTGTFSDKNVGVNKTVTFGMLELTGTDKGNYTVSDSSQKTTTASITPKSVTISGLTASDKVYDGTTTATVKTDAAIFDGKVTGDELGVSTTGTFSDKNVGVNKTVTFGPLELTGTDKGNYTVSDSSQKTTTASITPKSVTISGLTASDKVYDGTTTATVKTDAAVFDGKVTGDELGVSTTGTFSDKNVGVNKTVTFGPLELTGTDKGNYTVSDSSQKTTTASITPLLLTHDVVVTTSKVYDGTTDAAYTGGLTNVFSGDSVTLNAKFDYDNPNVGTDKPITATMWNISGDDAGNYKLGEAPGPFTGKITPYSITVNAIKQDLTYGQSVTGKEYTVEGGAGEVTITGEMGIDNDYRSGAGKLAVGQEYNFTQGTLDAGPNYTIIFNSASITVKQLDLTNDIVVTTSKVYDGTTDAAYTGGLTNVFSGDSVTLNAKFDYDNPNVGTDKPITATTWNISGDDAGNYNLGEAPGPFTGEITKGVLTVTANAQDLTYGENANCKDYTVEGGVGEVTITGEMGIDNESRSGAGKLQVGQEYNFTVGDLKADNYTIDFISASITVKQLDLTNDVVVTTSKVYDGTTDAAYTGGLTNVFSGDSVTLNAKFDYDNPNVGTDKPITATTWNISGDDAGNYKLGEAPGPFTGKITPYSITVNAIKQDLTYGQSVTGKEYTVEGGAGEVTITGEMGIDNDYRSGAGKLAVGQEYNFTQGTLDAGPNYTIIFNSASITVKQLDLTNDVVVTTSKVYDGTTDAAYTGGLTNVFSGDSVTLNAKFDYNSKNVASADTISATVWSISGDDAGNYELSAFTAISGNITPRTVTIISGSASKVYDGTPLINHTVTSYGFVSGEGATYNVTGSQTAVGSSLNTFTYTMNEGTLESNYTVIKVEGVLTVTPGPTPPGPIPPGPIPPGPMPEPIWGNGHLNFYSMSAGLNPNYASSAVTLVNRISSRMLDFGNPYTLSYAELVSAELKGMTYNDQIDQIAENNLNMYFTVHGEESLKVNDPYMDDEIMLRDNPMQILDTKLTSGTNLVNVKGFATGYELNIDIPVLPDGVSDIENVKFDSVEGEMGLLAKLNGTMEEIPSLFTELPEKASALKDDVERVLEQFIGITNKKIRDI